MSYFPMVYQSHYYSTVIFHNVLERSGFAKFVLMRGMDLEILGIGFARFCYNFSDYLYNLRVCIV